MFTFEHFYQSFPHLQGLPSFQVEDYSSLEYSKLYEQIHRQERIGIIPTKFMVIPDEWWNTDLDSRPFITVLIEEEYGYRHWIWKYFGTEKELLEDFLAGRFPDDFFFPPYQIGRSFWGVITDAREEEPNKSDYQYFIHVHETDDTFLEFGGKTYSLDGTVRDSEGQILMKVSKKGDEPIAYKQYRSKIFKIEVCQTSEQKGENTKQLLQEQLADCERQLQEVKESQESDSVQKQ